MSRRAQDAARTTERILEVAEALLAREPLASLTLARVAEGAEVTVQTVLRHMGSRDGLVIAVADRVRRRIAAHRTPLDATSGAAALDALLEHYELDGALVLNLLAQESADETARAAVAEGRATHRAWVRRHLLAERPAACDAVVDAAVAATDLYVWKLLRLDLGRSREQVAAVVQRLLRAALEPP